jgi:hypothetical protein
MGILKNWLMPQFNEDFGEILMVQQYGHHPAITMQQKDSKMITGSDDEFVVKFQIMAS